MTWLRYRRRFSVEELEMRPGAGKRFAMFMSLVLVVKSFLNVLVPVTDSQRGSFVNVGAFGALGGLEIVNVLSEGSQSVTFACDLRVLLGFARVSESALKCKKAAMRFSVVAAAVVEKGEYRTCRPPARRGKRACSLSCREDVKRRRRCHQTQCAAFNYRAGVSVGRSEETRNGVRGAECAGFFKVVRSRLKFKGSSAAEAHKSTGQPRPAN